MSFYDACLNGARLSLIAGPCIFESKQHALDMAGAIKEICDKFNINYIYKTSFDKANRSSFQSYRGAGFDEAYYGMSAVKEIHAIEVLTDVHEAWQCDSVAADIIQIPAFLCRQTDLLQAAAGTGKPVNVKKGQFLSPREMVNIIAKLESFGCNQVMMTERGTTFGYNDLVVDMRSLAIMKNNTPANYPVIMDCTHAVQSPGGHGTSSGGNRDMVPVIARAAVAVGVAGVFMEVHQDPDNAPCDGPNMLKLANLSSVLEQLLEIDYVVKKGVQDENW